jgi:hypothetical protein
VTLLTLASKFLSNMVGLISVKPKSFDIVNRPDLWTYSLRLRGSYGKKGILNSLDVIELNDSPSSSLDLGGYVTEQSLWKKSLGLVYIVSYRHDGEPVCWELSHVFEKPQVS